MSRPPKHCLLLNKRLFWMIRKAILQICCLFVIHFVKFFASFKMLSVMMKLLVEMFFFFLMRGFFHSRWSLCLVGLCLLPAGHLCFLGEVR